MRTRVVTVDAAAEHGDRRARRIERAAMCAAVDPAREARDDDDTGGGELARELARDVRAVVGAAARADDRDARAREQLRLSFTAQEEARRGIVDRAQPRRKDDIRASEPAQPASGERAHVAVRVERGFEAR